MSTFATIPGNPDAIDADAGQMQAVASAMAAAAAQLRSLTNNVVFVSAAVDKVGENAEQVAGDLSDASSRYAGTAEALTEYSSVLRNAQTSVDDANGRAGGLDVNHAKTQVSTLHHQYTTALHDPTTPSHDLDVLHHQLQAAQRDLDDQEQSLAALGSAVSAAQHDVDVAAGIAINKISDAIHSSSLNDSLFYKVTQTVKHDAATFKKWYDANLAPLFTELAKVIDDINDVLSVIAVVLAFIPGLDVLAGVIAAVSVALTLISFALNLANFAMGDESLGDIIASTVSTLVSLVPGGKAVKTLTGEKRVVARFASNVVDGGKLGKGVKYAFKMEHRMEKREITIAVKGFRKAAGTRAGWTKSLVKGGDASVDYLKDQVKHQVIYNAGQLVDGKRPSVDAPLVHDVQHARSLVTGVEHIGAGAR